MEIKYLGNTQHSVGFSFEIQQGANIYLNGELCQPNYLTFGVFDDYVWNEETQTWEYVNGEFYEYFHTVNFTNIDLQQFETCCKTYLTEVFGYKFI